MINLSLSPQRGFIGKPWLQDRTETVVLLQLALGNPLRGDSIALFREKRAR